VDKTESEYKLGNSELLEAFRKAAVDLAEAAERGSFSVPELEHEQEYLLGAILARFDGVKPPMDKGDVVRFKKDPTVVTEVYHAHYSTTKCWYLSFVGDRRLFFAEDYELVPAVEPKSS